MREEFGTPPEDPDADQTGRIEQFIGYFEMYVSTASGVQRRLEQHPQAKAERLRNEDRLNAF